MNTIEKNLKKLFEDKFSDTPKEIKLIPGGASDRKIYRLKSENKTAIGICNKKIKENLAFINFTNTFKGYNLNVPEIYLISKDRKYYIEEDLGNVSLYIISNSKKLSRNSRLLYYKNALKDLINFQLTGKDNIDFKYCYETKIFNDIQIKFDFNKFWEFYFLKFAKVTSFKKSKGNILNIILSRLLMEDNFYFMYRDFQPRNIMLKNNKLYYIDYQSGRKGPLQYDVASFLYSGSIVLSEKERNELLKYYLKQLGTKINFEKKEFLKNYYYFVLIRLLQVLGSYGYLYYRKKDKYVFKKIGKAKKNLKSICKYIEEEELKEFILCIVKSNKLM